MPTAVMVSSFAQLRLLDGCRDAGRMSERERIPDDGLADRALPEECSGAHLLTPEGTSARGTVDDRLAPSALIPLGRPLSPWRWLPLASGFPGISALSVDRWKGHWSPAGVGGTTAEVLRSRGRLTPRSGVTRRTSRADDYRRAEDRRLAKKRAISGRYSCQIMQAVQMITTANAEEAKASARICDGFIASRMIGAEECSDPVSRLLAQSASGAKAAVAGSRTRSRPSAMP
jgi:hypothetical protein